MVPSCAISCTGSVAVRDPGVVLSRLAVENRPPALASQMVTLMESPTPRRTSGGFLPVLNMLNSDDFGRRLSTETTCPSISTTI